ncbi:MAG: 8-amino-7-oxononanoate synthase [Phycisphaeraceae bacterium]
MDSLTNHLREDLARREAEDLLRQLRPVENTGPIVRLHGRDLINLASNDYLGLSQHPRLIQAAIKASQRYGTGSGASRLVVGDLTPHREAEEAFAAFKHAEAALLTGSGYLANLALMTSLAEPGDLIALDKLSHASLIDAARASGAIVRTFPHGDYDRMAALLDKHGRAARRRFVLTDSVFSMDGDAADLPTLCDLAEQYDAHVIVDEAHGTGVLGATGAGLVEVQAVSDRILAVVSTASKALGGLGGIITGPRVVIDTLINRARSLIYTTAPPASQAAALTAALSILRDEPQHQQRLTEMSTRVRAACITAGWNLPELAPGIATPIIPLIAGDTSAALTLAERLQSAGILAVAIRPPTVPPGSARVRLSLRADLTDEQVERVVEAVSQSAPGAGGG